MGKLDPGCDSSAAGHSKQSATSDEIVVPDLMKFVTDRVKLAYWGEDITCTLATLRIIGELFSLTISAQVYDASWGLNGHGNNRGECGLVLGTHMFISLLCARDGIGREVLMQSCSDFTSDYEAKFSSIQCRILRPQGFSPENPPHICEKLTVESIVFAVRFIADWFGYAIRESKKNH